MKTLKEWPPRTLALMASNDVRATVEDLKRRAAGGDASASAALATLKDNLTDIVKDMP